jgi:hypothetical protein
MKKLALLAFFYLAGLNLFAQVPSGEVGWWTLNEGSGSTALDSSGNGNNGTWYGSQTGTSGYYSAGYSQQWAGQFDGSTDYIDLGVPSALEIYSSLTISAWVYSTTIYGSAAQFVVAKDFSTGARGFGIGISNSGYLYIEVNGSAVLSSSGPVIGGTNVWHQIVVTNDGGTWTGYVDGTSVGSASPGTPSANTAAHWHIGNRAYVGVSNNFAGRIEDVLIYNSVLTAAQVSQLYGAGTSAPHIASLSPPSGTVGTAVTITGMNFGTTPGTVMFTNNVPATVSSGNWTNTSIATTVPLGATNGNIVVTVNGVQSNPWPFTVGGSGSQLPSTTSVTSNLNPSTYESPVTFTATVTPSTGSGTPTGTVTFSNNGAQIGTPQTLSGGTATLTTAALPASSNNSITASYSGDSSYTSSSATLVETVVGITSLSLTQGPPQMGFVITGKGFAGSEGNSTVTVNGVNAPILAWNTSDGSTSFTVQVPSNTPTGPVNVQVIINTVPAVSSNGVTFTVTAGFGCQ